MMKHYLTKFICKKKSANFCNRFIKDKNKQSKNILEYSILGGMSSNTGNIDYSNTIECSSTNQCNLKYGSNTNWVCNDKTKKCNLTCDKDSDCGENKYCSYNTYLNNNVCINIDYENLNIGCLNDSDLEAFKKNANITSIDSNNKSISDCVEWGRNQKCDGDQKCDYMVYKEPKESQIDWDSFKAQVDCSGHSTSVAAKIRDICTQNSDPNKCTMDRTNDEMRLMLANILHDGSKESDYNGRCGDSDYKFSYSYKCKDVPDSKEKSGEIYFGKSLGSADEINGFEMKCPVDDTVDLKATCMAGNLTEKQRESFVKNDNPNSCSYPIYNLPNTYTKTELKTFLESKYKADQERIAKEIKKANDNEQDLRIQQFMYKKRMQGDMNFSYIDAKNILAEEEASNIAAQKQYKREQKQKLNNKIMNNIKLQKKDSVRISRLENDRLVNNKKTLDDLDRRISTITSNIYNSQKKEKLNVKVTYFLSIFLLIIFLLAILIFIVMNIPAAREGASKMMNNLGNNNNNNFDF